MYSFSKITYILFSPITSLEHSLELSEICLQGYNPQVGLNTIFYFLDWLLINFTGTQVLGI